MTEYAPRPASIVREEISDLDKVLKVFPPALLETEVGRSYQHRMQDLRAEKEKQECIKQGPDREELSRWVQHTMPLAAFDPVPDAFGVVSYWRRRGAT